MGLYGPAIGGSKSPYMILTIPLVMLGIFRYQMLSESNQNSLENKYQLNILETPENVILNDKPIQLIVGFWLLIIIYAGLFN